MSGIISDVHATEVPTLAIEQTDPTTIETPIVTTDTPIVTMTARATDKLKEVLEKQGRTDLALRVYVTPGGCSGFSYGMTFAEGQEEDDTVVNQDGVRVVVDPMSAMYLRGGVIAVVHAVIAGGVALRRPDAVLSCGCGLFVHTARRRGTLGGAPRQV